MWKLTKPTFGHNTLTCGQVLLPRKRQQVGGRRRESREHITENTVSADTSQTALAVSTRRQTASSSRMFRWNELLRHYK